MKSYGKLTGWIIAGWFIFAVTASALHLFKNNTGRIGLEVAFAALTPIVIFAIWFATSENFRHFTLSLSPRALTLVQTWRLIGVTFVLLEARGQLPAVFALPAGYGDIFIGATAPLAAFWLAKPQHRNAFLSWQILGLADLVMAVSLGTTAQLLAPQAPSPGLMTVLPMSLIPTFAVPLMLILHMICIAQARTWKENVLRSHVIA
jgi:hypothetical protein